jgi:hypothetical protein
LHFFVPYSQQLRLLAAPSPLSLLIVGLLPVPEFMDSGTNKNKTITTLLYGFLRKFRGCGMEGKTQGTGEQTQLYFL